MKEKTKLIWKGIAIGVGVTIAIGVIGYFVIIWYIGTF